MRDKRVLQLKHNAKGHFVSEDFWYYDEKLEQT